ncbi:MAG TPA: RecX family transcriptional regulator [Thermoanaerobaculia bacterium]|nr:RecX family transcriptional regulator [Thermoanaerobaculia bacterium]
MTEPDPCYLAALRILNYRFNSEAELRRKLRKKEFESDAIDAAIARLRREKWLDDDRFAAALVRTRGQKRIGAVRIRRELNAAGVDHETATRAIANNVDPDAERERLAAACAKKIAAVIRREGELTDNGRKKVIAYLLARGYEMSAVLDVVRASRRDR